MRFAAALGLLLCFAFLAQAATDAPLTVTPDDAWLPAGGQASYYDDAEQKLAPARAAAEPALFQPAGRHVRHWGVGARWLRLPLHNNGSVAGQWLLSLGVPDAERLEVYRLSSDGDIATLLTLASDAAFSKRPVAERLLAVPVALAAGERTELLLRYRTHGDTPLNLELFSPQRFQQRLAESNLANGALLGVLLVLSLFALLQYLALGQRAFLAYVAMTLCMTAFLLQFEGYNFQYLWPLHGEWNQDAPIYLAAAVHFAHALFTMALFDLRQRFPRLYRLYWIYLLLPSASPGLYLASGWVGLALLAALAYVPLSVAAGVLFLRQRLPAAGFFLAGAVSYSVFGSLLFLLSVFGINSLGFHPFNYPKIGYLCEAVLFTIALARQVQAMRRRLEDGLRRHLAEAELVARVETEKHRALLAAQQQQLQLAAAGHDLSQPLASIRFALAALSAQSGNEAATRHIGQALNYTESLLHTLIDEAKRGYAERRQSLFLEDMLAEAQQRYGDAAQRKGLGLRYHPTNYRIDGSELVLGRILDNLLGNAIRYTARGGVLLGVRRRPDGLELQVLDTGPGFDTARRHKLLAPFEQSGRLAEESHGHGLGLYIVHALCAQSGYRLNICSTPGRGSSFGVLVPYLR